MGPWVLFLIPFSLGWVLLGRVLRTWSQRGAGTQGGKSCTLSSALQAWPAEEAAGWLSLHNCVHAEREEALGRTWRRAEARRRTWRRAGLTPLRTEALSRGRMKLSNWQSWSIVPSMNLPAPLKHQRMADGSFVWWYWTTQEMKSSLKGAEWNVLKQKGDLKLQCIYNNPISGLFSSRLHFGSPESRVL